MTFDVFDRCMALIRVWRSRGGRDDNKFPDSRSPELIETLAEFGIVPQDLEKSMVALAAFREANEDVYQTLSTITQVIKNRQLKGRFRDHITQVDHECQFPTMTLDEMKNNFYPGKTDNFQRLLENLDMILENRAVDLTQNACYWGEMSHLQNWLRRKLDNGEIVKTTLCGRFTFFKDAK